MMDFRIGIDLGGTKTEIIALDHSGATLLRRRIASPRAYHEMVTAIADLVRQAEHELRGVGSVGVGIPGAISPATGLVKNANSIWLNGQPLDADLTAALGREVRLANDANCFALSEATDGAAKECGVVFGVILGTGLGAGLVVAGKIIEGRHRIAGEFGHNPLPWPHPDEYPGQLCWCGQRGCQETTLSGTSLAMLCDGPAARDASALPARAEAGDVSARQALDRHVDRLARALAQVVNVLDPDAIVLGGGLSNMDHLYKLLPKLIPRHVYSDVCNTPILKNMHGDSSGVRGAAWLWPL